MTDNGANGRQREILIFEANGRQREILIFYLDEVCASFILVLVVQIVRTKKPRKASINIEAKWGTDLRGNCPGAVQGRPIDFQFI